jgi:hypothetical protein
MMEITDSLLPCLTVIDKCIVVKKDKCIITLHIRNLLRCESRLSNFDYLNLKVLCEHLINLV